MRRGEGRKRGAVVLVFGESENDRRAIRHLVHGLRPDLKGTVHERRNPLVLMKGALPEKSRENAEEIAILAKAAARHDDVLAVLAHQDCDDVEPAHNTVATKIETELAVAGCPNPIGVTPAWEIETWWLVFPEAVGKVVKGWRDPDDWIGKDVGVVRDSKEALRRAVRPRPRRPSSSRDYEERDSIAVAENIVVDGLLGSFDNGRRSTPHPSGSTQHTHSQSFERFRSRILKIKKPRRS
jgi:hypothetical protein